MVGPRKNNLLKVVQCILYKLKQSFQRHTMRKKSRWLLYPKSVFTNFQKQSVREIFLWYLKYNLRFNCLRVFSVFLGKMKAHFSSSRFRFMFLMFLCQKWAYLCQHTKRWTFSLSQMNNVELARTLSWRENVLLENEKRTINLFTSSLALLLTCQLVNLISCQLFGRKFNIESALFVHQSPSLPQKIDSREGLFRC